MQIMGFKFPSVADNGDADEAVNEETFIQHWVFGWPINNSGAQDPIGW